MATTGVIGEFCQGDDVDVPRTVPGIPAGDTVAKAWLLVKGAATDADGAAVVTKAITTLAAPGVGQVVDAGASGTATLLFQIPQAETAALTARRSYAYGIKVLLASGKADTIETGVLVADQGVVAASS